MLNKERESSLNVLGLLAIIFLLTAGAVFFISNVSELRKSEREKLHIIVLRDNPKLEVNPVTSDDD